MAAVGLPLLTAALGAGVSLSAINALGNALGLSSTTSELAMVLGVAVGIVKMSPARCRSASPAVLAEMPVGIGRLHAQHLEVPAVPPRTVTHRGRTVITAKVSQASRGVPSAA
jgi:hypothetical protein